MLATVLWSYCAQPILTTLSFSASLGQPVPTSGEAFSNPEKQFLHHVPVSN
jgi:hypothetical protein